MEFGGTADLGLVGGDEALLVLLEDMVVPGDGNRTWLRIEAPTSSMAKHPCRIAQMTHPSEWGFVPSHQQKFHFDLSDKNCSTRTGMVRLIVRCSSNARLGSWLGGAGVARVARPAG